MGKKWNEKKYAERKGRIGMFVMVYSYYIHNLLVIYLHDSDKLHGKKTYNTVIEK